MEIKMEKLLRCNWAVICRIENCLHSSPHLSHPDPNTNKPQCEDVGTFCYRVSRIVNCVEVGENVLLKHAVKVKESARQKLEAVLQVGAK